MTTGGSGDGAGALTHTVVGAMGGGMGGAISTTGVTCMGNQGPGSWAKATL